MTDIVLRISPDGKTIRVLYTEAIDLRALGTLKVERASHVEWSESRQAWFVEMADGTILPALFESRQDAIDAEVRYLNKQLKEGTL